MRSIHQRKQWTIVFVTKEYQISIGLLFIIVIILDTGKHILFQIGRASLSFQPWQYTNWLNTQE